MKHKWIASGVCGVLFLALMALVQTVDVAAIGPAETVIGLSHINGTVHELLGVHMVCYELTEVLGIAAIAVAGVFGLIGLVQLVRRKHLFAVDEKILVLGFVYAAVVVLYVLFEVLVINYRPVLMPGSELPEAAFPSSHTMLICVVMGSAMIAVKDYVKPVGLRRLVQVLCMLVIAVTVVGRLLSGVHWVTDILGGVLISLCLVFLYGGAADEIDAARALD